MASEGVQMSRGLLLKLQHVCLFLFMGMYHMMGFHHVMDIVKSLATAQVG